MSPDGLKKEMETIGPKLFVPCKKYIGMTLGENNKLNGELMD